MNERERLEEARKNLGAAFKALSDNLKLYGTAKVDYEKAKLGTIGTKIVDSFKNLKGSVQQFLQKKENKEKLELKPGTVQKTKTSRSKLGTIKNSFLEKLKTLRGNWDLKLKNAFEQIKITGTNIATSTVGTVNKVKDGIAKFTSEQINKFRSWKAQKAKPKKEKLELKPGTVQKTKTSRSKLGTIKNSFLEKMKSLRGNWDLKLKNAFEQIKITGTNIAAASVGVVNKAKDGVTQFTSKQIEAYRSWRIESQARKMEQKQKRDEELAAERDVLLQKNRELAERLKEAKEKLVAEMSRFKGEGELTTLEHAPVK